MDKAHSNKQQSAHICITYFITELWNNSFSLMILSFQINNRQFASTTLRSVKPALWFNTCPWWRHQMEDIFRVTGHLCGEFTGTGDFPAQRPMTRSFDGFFDLRLHKRLSKHSWGWWFETPSCPLWRHCHVIWYIYLVRLYSECFISYGPTED